jgi:hypothetical protein
MNRLDHLLDSALTAEERHELHAARAKAAALGKLLTGIRRGTIQIDSQETIAAGKGLSTSRIGELERIALMKLKRSASHLRDN